MAGPASLLAWLALVLLSIPLAGTFATLGAVGWVSLVAVTALLILTG